jgi:ribosomal protein S12 methylthiotransferase accessory factor
MKINNTSTLTRSLSAISPEIGIIKKMNKLPSLNGDPLTYCYGANSLMNNSVRKYYSVVGGSCNERWDYAILATIGEALERYAASFYDINECKFGSYNKLMHLKESELISVSEFALYHDQQFTEKLRNITRFTENTELTWFPTLDLTSNKKVWLPGQFIYLPFFRDKNYITLNVSTGLASHVNYYKAILTCLYEVIERDSFVLTWWQKISPPQIVISEDIISYIQKLFPVDYEWYFFDITYDIQVPTVMCLCYVQTECGKIPIVSSATRHTFSDAIKKSIYEIAQSIPLYRLQLENNPNKQYHDFSKLISFDDHAWFYMINKNMWHVFDRWKDAKERKNIDFNQIDNTDDKIKITSILSILKAKSYNVLLKDITTPDLRQIGFYAIKIYVPQLLPLSGAYGYYFLGGKRLYSVPTQMGYKCYDFEHLNEYPHPFP